ncbi:MAG: hypothetical protein R2867_42070 [Caldilineaceae bacterium]
MNTYTIGVIVRDSSGAEDKVEFELQVNPGGPMSSDGAINAAGAEDEPNTPVEGSSTVTTTQVVSETGQVD